MHIEELPTEIILTVLAHLDVKTRITVIRRLNKFWNNMRLSIDDPSRYKVQNVNILDCDKTLYHFVGYAIQYKKVYEIMKSMDNDKIYNQDKINNYLIKNNSVQIMVEYEDYDEEDVCAKEQHIIGMILNPCSIYVKIFMKSLKSNSTCRNELTELISTNKIKYYFNRKIYKIYSRAYRDIIHKTKKDKYLFYYMKHVLNDRDMKLNEFLDTYKVNMDDLISIICPDINLATRKALYNIKPYSEKRKLFKKRTGKLYYKILDINKQY